MGCDDIGTDSEMRGRERDGQCNKTRAGRYFGEVRVFELEGSENVVVLKMALVYFCDVGSVLWDA